MTQQLRALRSGDQGAWERLLPLVYEHLRNVAGVLMKGERRGHTLQPTALVHEAFLRLSGGEDPDYLDRQHFLAIGARSMRQVLVDHARARGTGKRGGAWSRVEMGDELLGGSAPRDVAVLDLHEALQELQALDERQAQVVELKYFGGMTLDEVSDYLGISRTQVKMDWTVARAWLLDRLGSDST